MSSKIPQRPAVDGSTRVIERPDGFYWIDEDTREESGPFATLEQAVADMQAAIAPGSGSRDRHRRLDRS